MKKALIRNSLIAFMIIVLITGIASFVIMKNAIVGNAYNDMERNLAGFLYMLNGNPDAGMDENCKNFGEYTGTRITVIDPITGEVLGDSFNDISFMDNHLYREEVTQALSDGEGRAIRHSRTQSVDFLYLAKKVRIDNEYYIVRAATELLAVKSLYIFIGSSMLIAVLSSTFIAFFIVYSFNNRVVKPINEITDLASDISRGNYGKSAYITSYAEVEKLSGAINQLSQRLKVSFDNISVRTAQLEAILHSFNHGILVCDNDGKVQYSNENFIKILGLDEKLESMNIYKFMFDENIYSILEEIKKRDDSSSVARENIQFSDGTFRNYSGCRIKDNTGENKGILLLVEDVTNVRKLERMRSTFVSNVTHELKTPITCISGYTQTLLNGAMDDKENARKFLMIIDEESQRLNLLVDDILTLSEIENNKNIHFDTEVDMLGLTNDVIELMKRKYPEKANVALRLDAEENETYFVPGDRHKLKQILINLVDNSIKHTSEGFVSIKLMKNVKTLSVQVQDTGSGIEEKHLARVFERFYRVDKHRSREMGGTGLGLSIVKHLVLLHNGTISIESKLGQGTTVEIEFPVLEV